MLSALQRLSIINALAHAGIGNGAVEIKPHHHAEPSFSLDSDYLPSPNRMSQAKRRRRAKWTRK